MTMQNRIVILTFCLLLLLQARAQNEANYSPVFLPVMKAELPEEVKETSGLFFHNGRLWTHNDSGGQPVLYGLDTVNFKVAQRITLANVKNTDWEEVCSDGENVFVGDIGNNRGSRKDLKIYTFPLSSITIEGDATIAV